MQHAIHLKAFLCSFLSFWIPVASFLHKHFTASVLSDLPVNFPLKPGGLLCSGGHSSWPSQISEGGGSDTLNGISSKFPSNGSVTPPGNKEMSGVKPFCPITSSVRGWRQGAYSNLIRAVRCHPFPDPCVRALN